MCHIFLLALSLNILNFYKNNIFLPYFMKVKDM